MNKDEALWSPYVGLWVLYFATLFLQFVAWLMGFGAPETFTVVLNWIFAIILPILGLCIYDYKSSLKKRSLEWAFGMD